MNAPANIQRAKAFDPVAAERVLDALADGKTLKDACEGLSVSASSVRRWVAEVDTFAVQYARARQLQLDNMADELIPIADDDTLKPEDRKVRVDTRKWLLSKLASQTYGDKLDVTSKGEALAAPTHMVDARVQSIVMQAALRMQAGLEPDVAGLLE